MREHIPKMVATTFNQKRFNRILGVEKTPLFIECINYNLKMITYSNLLIILIFSYSS